MNRFLTMVGNGFDTLVSGATKVYSAQQAAKATQQSYSLQSQQLSYELAQQKTQAAATAATAAQQQTMGNILTYGSIAAGLALLYYLITRYMRGK